MSFFHGVECDYPKCNVETSVVEAFPDWDGDTCPIEDSSYIGGSVPETDPDAEDITVVSPTGWIATVRDETYCSRDHYALASVTG